MRRKLAAGVIGLFLLCTAATALAGKVAYEFSFSGSQVRNEYVSATGADGSTAVDNGLYSGARRFSSYDGGVYSSFEASSQGGFINWLVGADRLVDINLWGYGGAGANWGESFKVDQWNSPSVTDASWEPYVDPYPWSPLPENNNGDLLGWWLPDSDYNDGIGFFNQNQSDYPIFTFTLTLDTDDPAFGGDSPWFMDNEGLMVFWFGAEAMNWQGEYTGRYEGNLLLQGKEVAPVPEPAAMLLFGTGLACLIGIRKRRL